MTINDVMNKLNVDKATAYGFLRFLETKGLVVASGTEKTPGAKGKGLKVYQFSDSAPSDLAGLVTTLSK